MKRQQSQMYTAYCYLVTEARYNVREVLWSDSGFEGD